jgi:hypothetical protein
MPAVIALAKNLIDSLLVTVHATLCSASKDSKIKLNLQSTATEQPPVSMLKQSYTQICSTPNHHTAPANAAADALQYATT